MELPDSDRILSSPVEEMSTKPSLALTSNWVHNCTRRSSAFRIGIGLFPFQASSPAVAQADLKFDKASSMAAVGMIGEIDSAPSRFNIVHAISKGFF